MTSSGYGVEATVESIWNTAWATARFDFINIALGGRFNFWITGDAGTDITNVLITDLLEVESNDLFAYWNAIAKVEKTVNPWDFIQIWMANNLMGDGFLTYFEKTIEKCKNIIGEGGIEMVKVNLPSGDNSV